MRSLDILVVDDDDADALMISEALAAGETPAVVRRAVDGQEALDYLRRMGRFADAQRPDLILTTVRQIDRFFREVAKLPEPY